MKRKRDKNKDEGIRRSSADGLIYSSLFCFRNRERFLAEFEDIGKEDQV